ncbi:HvfC/BufC N-terminal domain-containing protein [Chitinophaga nivalis]|uniref:DNA-binding domain-containing protein n=1 Tax=Chitinophaga nivalis TaxID=2991709 RepID=A0ABT3IR44_9BACT|nr:DNA-binding domain-containing protein [Chitinophaga nivalis]MCW3463892.1 DNA-binding domain-containing protein [Chitinophaga nivalis]MCW3486418.1 DNA-binding domain-containing protein [Chitinophaga nivalis]
MNLLPDTYHIQQTFSTYCRTGEKVRLPGVAPERLKHYRRLVFNMITDTMESAFPIACKHIPTRKWNHMVKTFFSCHACRAWQVWKLPLEFYTYAVENNWEEVYGIPYLNDLLAFEWAEMEVYNMEDIPAAPHTATGDWLETPLVLNPEHRLLALNYPVHTVANEKALRKNKGVYFVLLYRDAVTGHVTFMDLSPWLAFVIEQLVMGITVKGILSFAPALQLDITDTDTLEKDTLAFLHHLHRQGFVPGFQC